MEAEGECMILRPRTISINQHRKEPETIQEMYDLGRRDAEEGSEGYYEFGRK